MQHIFFVYFFAVVLHDCNVIRPETSWLQVLWRNGRTCSSLPLIFSWVAASISHFPTAATNSFCSSNKKWLLICRSFCRWASLALCRLFSLFLCLSLSLYSAFVDMTINLRLILLTTRIQKQFPLSVFFFIDSLGVSVSQDTGDYAISHQNNLVLHLGYHTCWLSWFILVCLWCGRTGGRSRDYQNFSDHIFGGMGLRSRAWSSSKNTIIGVLEIYLLTKIRNELYHRSLTSLRKMDIGRIERYPA